MVAVFTIKKSTCFNVCIKCWYDFHAPKFLEDKSMCVTNSIEFTAYCSILVSLLAKLLISIKFRCWTKYLGFTCILYFWKSPWNNRCQSAYVVMLFVFNQPRFVAHSEWNVGGCRTNAEKFVENLNSENQLLNFELDVCDAMSSFLAN